MPAASADNNRAHASSCLALYEVPVGKGRSIMRQHGEAARLRDRRLAVERHLQLDGRAAVHAQLIGTAIPIAIRAGAVRTWSATVRPAIRASSAGSTTSRVAADGQRPGRRTVAAAAARQVRKRGPKRHLWGPRFSQLDMSFFKTFAMTERYQVQFRAESFNFANHTNLAQSEQLRGLPRSRRAHLRRVRQLRSAAMADGGAGGVLERDCQLDSRLPTCFTKQLPGSSYLVPADIR